jgi:hypothetical protein
MTEFPCEDIGQVAMSDVEEYVAAYTMAKYEVPGR